MIGMRTNVTVNNNTTKKEMTVMKSTNTAKEVMKQAIKDMTKELNLKQYPTVTIETEDKNYVMAATGTLHLTGGLFHKTIVRTESDYVLHVNKNAINRQIKRYAYTFGNKQAAYDCLYLLICHELRHMWQYQEQYQVGSEYDELHISISESFNGHGSTPEEIDANNWMIKVAENKGLKYLACYMELEQRAGGLCNHYNADFSEEVANTYLETVEAYNKALHHLLKFLKK